MYEENWVSDVTDEIEIPANYPVGLKIVAFRRLTAKEAEAQGWDEGKWQWNDGVVLELEDGSLLMPSADWEGNKAGAMFATYKNRPLAMGWVFHD